MPSKYVLYCHIYLAPIMEGLDDWPTFLAEKIIEIEIVRFSGCCIKLFGKKWM